MDWGSVRRSSHWRRDEVRSRSTLLAVIGPGGEYLYVGGAYSPVKMGANREAQRNMDRDVRENPALYEAAAASPDDVDPGSSGGESSD